MYNDVITINCPMLAKSIIVNNIKVRKVDFTVPFCEHLTCNALRCGSSFTCKLHHTCHCLVSVQETAPLLNAVVSKLQV